MATRRPSTHSLSGRSNPPASPRSPTYQPMPRPQRPANPPEPPLTLLHPSHSRPTVPTPVHASSINAEDEDGDAGTSTTPTLAGVGDRGGVGEERRTRKKKSASIPFKGMWRDVKARIPYYWSDWTDAANYRVVPATLFIFFANVLPALSFSLELIETTNEYGVQEVLLASFMAAFVAAFLGGQPLLISGVTGPITVFNHTIYEIFQGRNDFNYLQFMGWVYLWGAILHWIAASMNAVQGLKYVTRFSCDTFGFYVASVYVQYGIQTVTRQFSQTSNAASFLGIILAIITLILPHYFNAIARSGLINKNFRRFCADYGMPITIIAITGLAYWGRFDKYVLEGNMTLPTTIVSFQPANGRPWLVKFWELEGQYVGMALPFGIVLFILFYFDANVSSLIAQGSEFPLRKPAAFHWDFFLLGITTFIAGLLGTPAPNGLIPQAPLHTASLVVMGYEGEEDGHALLDVQTSRQEQVHSMVLDEMENGQAGYPQNQNTSNIEASVSGSASGVNLEKRRSKEAATSAINGGNQVNMSSGSALSRRVSQLEEGVRVARERRRSLSEKRKDLREVPVAVVEQRVSNLAQGCLCLILMTTPFEHILGLVPKGVLAGLFWYMGTDALLSSGVTEKMLYLVRERRATSPTDPLNKVRKSRIILFTLIELIGFGATFAITQTIAAIGFPVIIMLLVPLRVFVIPYLGFTQEELDILDGPVASPFTMESVGGSL